MMMDNTISVGISLPKKVIEQIDIDRQDISRSRYLLRLVERSHAIRNRGKSSLDVGFEGLVSSEPTR
jgi:hypothetical protein